MNVLAFSPHSDDVELGCGGYLSKLIKGGHTVFVACVLVKDEKKESGDVRRGELYKSLSRLGVQEVSILFDGMSQDFDLCSQPKQKTVQQFDSLIEKINPTQVLLPVPSFHQEHQWVFEVGIAATRPTKSCFTSEVLAYEYPAAGWGPSGGLDPMRGGTYIQLNEDNLKDKLSALKCHESQGVTTNTSLISLRAVELWAQMRGLECGCKYAELLYTLRRVVP